MGTKTVLVVGDRFESFANNDSVISISTAEEMLVHGRLPPDRTVRMLLGQGVPLERLENLFELAQNCAANVSLEFARVEKAGRKHSHKHKVQNSMISMPRRIGPTTFELDVLLDDGCAELSDHQTGQHIQGMVLLEATRQSFIAVAEEFYLKNDSETSYFVLNQMTTEYLQFVFPLPIRIICEVQEHQAKRGGAHRFKYRLSVVQNGKVCCIVDTRFSTYYDSFISGREIGLVKEALEQGLTEVAFEQEAVA